MPGTCSQCGGRIRQTYMPMEEWDESGPLCGGCYSRLIARHYPGDHVRIGG